MQGGDWDPGLYTRFEAQRTRPAADLLAQVRLDRAERIVDLGCGPGNSTALLAQRFPKSQLLGIDSSAAMLATARQRLPQVAFERADIGSWIGPAPVDLLYANAALQWVPDHARLLPQLLSQLRAGGVLALQVPDNRDEPSHSVLRALAAEAPFASLIGAAAAERVRIETPERYLEILAPRAGVDLWRTTYFHVMPSVAAIVAWLRSTALRPFLEPLKPAWQSKLLTLYEERLERAYPPLADGTRLLRYPRLFLIARRG